MNSDEKMLCRIMFKTRVAYADGQGYEDLFSTIMGHARPQFVQVKPQGKIGDRKNDGYDKATGHYFQVFAPENPRQSQGEAVAKLKRDFAGLKEYWNNIHPIKAFSFAFNDKYSGTFPTIEADLNAIKTANSLSQCDCFLAKHLEDVFFSLADDVIFAVIGRPPDPHNISNVDYSILKEVIDHVLALELSLTPESVLIAPDFTAKIAFNHLSRQVATLLTYGSYQSGGVDNYFSLNSNYARQQLRDTLNSLYLVAKGAVPTNANLKSPSDLVFFQVLSEIASTGGKARVDAAIVVMAFFFETCDIFDDPTGG